jgi:hypothetical protein
MSSPANTNKSPLASVFGRDGKKCIGFILRRGAAGVEAFTADVLSLGLWDTANEAIAAVLDAEREQAEADR